MIFDLDGVLIDSRDTHYETLNKALALVDPRYVISKEEHLAIYDGLPTKKKLEMLESSKGLPKDQWDFIWTAKQSFTVEALNDILPDTGLIDICVWLKNKGYMIAVASNAVENTVKKALEQLGIRRYIQSIQTNANTSLPKPYPEMYWNCMVATNAIPRTTLIVEDSHIGRQGALDSGAHLLAVENRKDLTLNKVDAAVQKIELNRDIKIPWRDTKLNVVIPMAGLGSRFSAAGYTFPKPLIDVEGKPMIQAVVENLNIEANFIFIVQKEHYEKYNLELVLNLVKPGCRIIQIDGLTDGAASTVLTATPLIDNDNPLLLVNSDQIVDWNANEVMYAFSNNNIDGGILTFKSTHPKWSYAKLDDDGFVTAVAEKKPISDNATVGIYYWKHGKDFVDAALDMIEKNIRTNGEFYVAPAFNQAIAKNKKFRIKEVPRMWGIGDPESLNSYLARRREDAQTP